MPSISAAQSSKVALNFEAYFDDPLAHLKSSSTAAGHPTLAADRSMQRSVTTLGAQYAAPEGKSGSSNHSVRVGNIVLKQDILVTNITATLTIAMKNANSISV